MERKASMWVRHFVIMLRTDHALRLPRFIAMESRLAGRTMRLRTDLIMATMAGRRGSSRGEWIKC
jgi:hypothetical protein